MRHTVSCCLPWLINGSVLVKWPESTMTLDRHGAVAVCRARYQQSVDWSEDNKMFEGMGETLGNMHVFARDFGESELKGEARRGKKKTNEGISRVTLQTRDAVGDMRASSIKRIQRDK